MAVLKMGLVPWPAIDSYLQSENPTVLIPISPVEEHGPHLPCGTDYLLTEKIVLAVAERIGCAVFPTITLMCCGISAQASGTICISEETLRAIVRDLVIQLGTKGFRRIVFASIHWGFSINAMKAEIESLKPRLNGTLVEVIPVVEVCRVPEGVIETRGDTHAGEIETSGMLHTFPELVGEIPQPDWHDRSVTPPVLSNSGVDGDPTKATAEKGQILMEATIEGLMARLKNCPVAV